MTFDPNQARHQAAETAYPHSLPARRLAEAVWMTAGTEPVPVRVAGVDDADRFPHDRCCDLTGTEYREPIDEWQSLAECAGADMDDFFPDRGEHNRIRRAKAVCAFCPVRPECLKHALDNYEKHGLWGGHTEQERRVVRRQFEASRGARAQPIVHGTPRGFAQEQRAGIEPCPSCRAAYNAHERARKRGRLPAGDVLAAEARRRRRRLSGGAA